MPSPAGLCEVSHSPMALKVQYRHDEDRQDDEKKQCDSKYLTHDRPHGSKTE